MKRRIGPAWLERVDEGLVRRRGRVKPGFFDEHGAIVAKDRLVRQVEAELARQAAEAEREANAPITFRGIAQSYLEWLTHVKEAKPATLRDHRYLLAEPGACHRRGHGAHAGAIMIALGGRPAAEVTTREINALRHRRRQWRVSAHREQAPPAHLCDLQLRQQCRNLSA